MPGVGRRSAEVILSEIGTDMARFGSARRLASWAGMCPGNLESAGVQHGGQTRKGSPWLRSALVNSARSASRTKTYLGAQYHRLAARRGAKRAFMAVGPHDPDHRPRRPHQRAAVRRSRRHLLRPARRGARPPPAHSPTGGTRLQR
ncbi:MAG: transposase [Candidatus Limnocylindrales bacterium]